MFNTVIEFILRKTKKKYLIPFIRGLTHLGRPSQVFFPAELLEQGLSLALSGLNNTMAIQSNPDWIWPFWYELQKDPESEAFLPTGMNLVTANLVRRNWTSVGLTDSAREAMVDPVGMVTPRAYGWSVFSYLRFEGADYFPPLSENQTQQSLIKQTGPGIQTQYKVHPNISWNNEVHTIKYHGEEFAYLKVTVTNKTSQAISLDLGLSIRPYNCLTIGHINKMKFKDQVWRINQKPGVLLLQTPDQVFISDRHLGDPLKHQSNAMKEANRFSKSGIMSGNSEYQIELEALETASIECLLYIKGGNKHSLKFISTLTQEEIHQHIHAQLKDQEINSSSGMQIEVPDLNIQNSFDAVKKHLHVFDDQSHFSPGTFFYHNAWIRDSAFIVMAFHKIGWHSLIDVKMDNLLKQQTKDGFFKSQTGEWDSNGQALYTLVTHARYTANLDALRTYYPYLIKGVKWIQKKREFSPTKPSIHEGLLPAGFSAEHFGPNDHYYWDNYWALAGIQEVQWAAKKLNRIDDLLWLEELHEEYSINLKDNMEYATEKNQGVLPSSPYRQADSASIGNMIALWPLKLYDKNEAWIQNTQEYLWKHNVYQGMFFQKIIHTGLNAYLTAQLAHVYLEQQDSRAFELIQGILDWASPTYTWPEAIHPRTRGGCMGDGHHGWAAAEWIGLIHHLFINETKESITLGANIPQDWYAPENSISIRLASCQTGTISYSITTLDDSYHISWEFIENPMADNVQLHWMPPFSQELITLDAHQGTLSYSTPKETHV